MADEQHKTVIRLSAEGDPRAAKGFKEALDDVREAASGASSEEGKSGAAAKSAGDDMDNATRKVEKHGDAYDKAAKKSTLFSKACQTSTRDMVRSISQWVSGFGAFSVIAKLIGAFEKLQEWERKAGEEAVKAATEIEKVASKERVKNIQAMADAQKESADALGRQAANTRSLNQAQAAAEDAAFGERLAGIDLEEAEALSQLDVGDSTGRARVSYKYSTMRRQAQHEQTEASASRTLSQAEADEATAKQALDKTSSDAATNEAAAQKTLAEIKALKAFLADPAAISLAAQKAWTASGGAGGIGGLGRQVAATKAAAETRLNGAVDADGFPVGDGGLVAEHKLQADLAAKSRAALPDAQTAHDVAATKRQTAARSLESVRATGPSMNIAAARTGYKALLETEKKDAEAKAKKEKQEADRKAALDALPKLRQKETDLSKRKTDAEAARDALQQKHDRAAGEAQFSMSQAGHAATRAERAAHTGNASQLTATANQAAADIKAYGNTINILAKAIAEVKQDVRKAEGIAKAGSIDTYQD